MRPALSSAVWALYKRAGRRGYLVKRPGAKVEVKLEIQAEIPKGAPDDIVRTVSENCSTLKFNTFEFEDS